MSTLVDLLRAPWAIVPDRLIEIQEIYRTHLKGDKIDLGAIEARLGRPLANEQQEYQVREGGIAVLAISGAIANKANMFTRVSGGASAQLLQKQVESMRADPRVRGVVLDFDTPGGSVLGIPALAESITALAAEKPTVSCSSGSMCSAGYWLGSAANAVYISGLTDYVGSIGVVATHQYDPKSANVQTTEITAGKYKRVASEAAPLTAEGKAYIQAQIDEVYRVFVDTVARNRRVSAEQVLEHMADGRVFIGQQAIDAGLVDGVSTVDAMVERMAENPDQFTGRRKARIGALGGPAPAAGAKANDEPVLPVASETSPKGTVMTPQELAAQFAAENSEACALIRAEGAAAERARIQAVREQTMPGHEALIDALAFDGKTTGPEAAVQILAAERAKLSGQAAARAADGVKPVAQAEAEEPQAAKPATAPAGVPGFAVDTAQAELDQKARAYMAANPGTGYLAAIKAVSI